MKKKEMAFVIMERDHKTGESIQLTTIVAINSSAAKSKFHIDTGVYDNGKKSYWIKSPVCR